MDRTDYNRQLLAAIRLARLPGVGAKRFASLTAAHGGPLAALLSLEEPPTGELFPAAKSALAAEVAAVEARLAAGEQGVYFGAPDYPPALAAIPEPPPYLFRRGPLWPLPSRAIAIVGRREASPAGREFARQLAAALAGRGALVVSGGAVGIDAAAHEGALAVGGRTALIAATGLDVCYPAVNRGLFARVAEAGCLLTELLPGAPPRRDFFPTRNRIIAGLSLGVVIVEGRRRSGSASTYRHARRFGRPVLAWIEAPNEGAELPQAVLAAGGLPLSAPDADAALAAIDAAVASRRAAR
jgi:DNA processing protein